MCQLALMPDGVAGSRGNMYLKVKKVGLWYGIYSVYEVPSGKEIVN